MTREMKDSGVGWIGNIPNNWKQVPNYVVLKNTADLIGNREDQFPLLSLTKKGIILRDLESGGKFPASFEKYKVVKPGQIVFCLFDLDETPRTVGLSNLEGMITGAYDVFNINKSICNPKYVFYFYLAVDNGKYLRPYYGSLRKTVTPSAFLHLNMLYPPISEQSVITIYLDSKCAQLDSQISNQEKLIEELEEYKKSLITEAVTKGLDPNVEMKDSGVEWIGEIPYDWEIIKIRNCANVIRGGSPRPIDLFITDDEDGIPWIKIGDTVKGSKFIDKVAQKISPNGLSKTRYVEPGTLILSNSMSFGEPYILNIAGCIHDGWLALKPTKGKISVNYFYYYLDSNAAQGQFDTSASGGVVQNLNIDKVKDTEICIPDCPTQELIAMFLDTKCAQIDHQIEKRKELIEKLKEYKSSLIYEVVTGKKEVPIDESECK